MYAPRYRYAPITLATLLLIFLFASIATAQTPRFGVRPVVPFAGVKDVKGMAMNKLGEVVGEITFTANGNRHAFLRLPSPNYGLNAGMYDLSALAGLSSGDVSIAHDINDSGVIVGENDGEAFVWDMYRYGQEETNWSDDLGTAGAALGLNN